MRIATAIISIIMSVVLYDFGNTASLAGSLANSDELSAIAGAAFVGAAFWMIGGALIYFAPLVSLVLYVLSFIFMAVINYGASVTSELFIYTWVAPVLALMAFFGWRGKRKADAEKREEKERQLQRDQMLEQMLLKQSQQ